jgi:hypothetical protein
MEKKRKENDELRVYCEKNGPKIDAKERTFWKKKIKKYLKPLEQDKNKEKAATEALIGFIDLSWASSRIFVSAVIWISVDILWYSIHINCINKRRPKTTANRIEIGTILTSLPPHVNFTDRVSLNALICVKLNIQVYCNKNRQEVDDQETEFWKKKIRKYLKPLEQDKNKEKAATEALQQLCKCLNQTIASVV